MQPQLEILQESVRRNQLQSSTKTKKTHDAHHNVKIPNFAVENRVCLNEQPASKLKLGHKTSQKFKGPYLIVEANKDFYTYKLQNCKNNKIHPSLIHADRLRLCNTERDQFYSNIAVQADVKTNMNGHTISKTATDSSMEAGHKQTDATGALALPLQTADDVAAASMPAAAKQRPKAATARKQSRKQPVFHRSKAVSGASQAAATAAGTQAQALTRDKQT